MKSGVLSVPVDLRFDAGFVAVPALVDFLVVVFLVVVFLLVVFFAVVFLAVVLPAGAPPALSLIHI